MHVVCLPSTSYSQARPCLCEVRTLRPRRSHSRARHRRVAAAVSTGSPVKTKLTVAVDVDEVLGRFLCALNQFCAEEHDIVRDVSDFWVYEFAKIWGCDQDRSNHLVHEFFKSPHFNDGIPIIPGSFEALQRLKESHDLVVVTSRQYVIQDVTLEWIDRHFPDTFSNVYFGNHFAMSGASRKKSDICRDIGASVLIDDNPTYALQHENITVVRHWDEVEACLQRVVTKV